MISPTLIFISAGEASGDMYGALLIQALRKQMGSVQFFGCGGERMRAAGCDTVVDARQVAMVGLVEVIPGLPRAVKAFRSIVASLNARRPALAILIDFPDFNLRLAKKLKAAGIEVIYFIAPQVWAWRRGRLSQLRQYVDHLLCIFPFEEEFFRNAGVTAEFIGHPLVGRVGPTMTAAEFRNCWRIPQELPLIALLPGSRRKEILLNLPPMLDTARNLAKQGDYGFVVAASSSQAAHVIRSHLKDPGQRFFVIENHTYDAVAHAEAAVVASGTATIETALLGTPMAVIYRVTPLSWWLGRRLVRTPFYSMVNLVMGRRVVNEFIQDEFQPEAVAREIRRLAEDQVAREEMRESLLKVAERLRTPVSSRDKRQDELVETMHVGPEKADAIERSVAVMECLLQTRFSI